MTGVRIGVVVPVNDEAALLDDCLAGLATAVRVAGGRARVHVLVVLDRCSDASGEIARRRSVPTLAVDAGVVGAARAAGCAAVIRDGAQWLACTDADSVVPPDWLLAHLDAHTGGYDALLGTVRVEGWEDRPAGTSQRFAARYVAGRGAGHPHVHGANLGVRASAYRLVGGFAPLAHGEDVALVESLERRGAAVRRTGDVPVRTSSRRVARAPGGFAARLGGLEPTG